MNRCLIHAGADDIELNENESGSSGGARSGKRIYARRPCGKLPILDNIAPPDDDL